MIAYNFNPLCKQAEPYYYDFLCGKDTESIPEFVINHIEQCQYCKAKINQLEGIISEVESYSDSEQRVNLAVIAWLKLHFAYIGKEVACKTVRPFLPGFLEPALEIKVPTPITAHLDNCRQCLEDLEAIRQLNLNHKQLYRLSQLFAEKDNMYNVSCLKTQAAVSTVTSMVFCGTTEEILKHLCTCSDCRKVLYQRREVIRNDSLSDQPEQGYFPCEEVSMSDIFDYTIPYGLDPANDQYAKFRQSLTSHIRTCPVCLAKMQKLHNTIYNIIDRTESEVVTMYHIDKSVKSENVENSNDVYAGFPIKVETVGHKGKVITEQPASITNTVTKRKTSATNIKPFFKIAASAAAVILIATMLFLNIPAAKAITLERIYKAIERIKNVHILSFVPDKEDPVQEQWVSRVLNVNIIKTKRESILRDLVNKVEKVKYLDSSLVKATTLSAEMIAGTRDIINSSLGLIPFYSISEVPNDAVWEHVDDKSLEITNKTEVYDLIWTEKAYESYPIFKKWRFFVNSETNLPQKIEFYQKPTTNGEFNLKYTRIVRYLDEREMQTVIKDVSL